MKNEGLVILVILSSMFVGCSALGGSQVDNLMIIKHTTKNITINGSYWNQSGNVIYPSELFYSVAIGKTEAGYKLDVDGGINASSLDITGDVYIKQLLNCDADNEKIGVDSNGLLFCDVNSGTENYILNISTDDGSINITNSEILSILGGDGIDTEASGNTITIINTGGGGGGSCDSCGGILPTYANDFDIYIGNVIGGYAEWNLTKDHDFYIIKGERHIITDEKV